METVDVKKQKLLLEYALSSTDIFARCSSIIRPEYFDPSLKSTVKFALGYHQSFHALPDAKQIKAETDVDIERHVVTKDQINYCCREIESFCQQQGLIKAILQSPKLIDKGDYGKIEKTIRDALSISLNKELGTSYFENPEQRIAQSLMTEALISTGWKCVDDSLYGGVARKQLLMFSANSGGGKSIALANLGINLAKQKLNVLYISLELSEMMISKRLDSMITGVHQKEWNNKTKDIINSINTQAEQFGDITIKRMPSGTKPMQIRSYLKEFELSKGFIPDVLLVDYLDLMQPNEKVSADNVFEKDKRSSEQLRDILDEYNMIGASASQQNRSGVTATELNQAVVAGGISKVNTSDNWISIVFNNVMRASGEIAFQFLKTRSSDGVGSIVYLTWDNKSLLIIDNGKNKSTSDMSFLNKQQKQKTTTEGLFEGVESDGSELFNSFQVD